METTASLPDARGTALGVTLLTKIGDRHGDLFAQTPPPRIARIPAGAPGVRPTR